MGVGFKVLSCSYVANQKSASRKPSSLGFAKMLGSRVLQSARTGGASKVAQRPRWNSLADCTTTEQHLQCYTELHVQTIRYKVIASYMCRERPGVLPSPTQAGAPDTRVPAVWVVGLFYGLGGAARCGEEVLACLPRLVAGGAVVGVLGFAAPPLCCRTAISAMKTAAAVSVRCMRKLTLYAGILDRLRITADL